MKIRRAQDRGRFKNEWLDTHYSFSFAEYFDPAQMGFHTLRVINEDIVAPAGGFPAHGHRDMEIITYIVNGTIAHKDSMGNVETLTAGEVQVMSAGRGVRHSEFNPSREERLQLLQIWIEPAEPGIQPGYSQRKFTRGEKLNRMCLLASPAAQERSLKIHQDARIFASILEAGKNLDVAVETQRSVWLQMISGSLQANEVRLSAGDGLGVDGPLALDLRAEEECEFILFDLARR